MTNKEIAKIAWKTAKQDGGLLGYGIGYTVQVIIFAITIGIISALSTATRKIPVLPGIIVMIQLVYALIGICASALVAYRLIYNYYNGDKKPTFKDMMSNLYLKHIPEAIKIYKAVFKAKPILFLLGIGGFVVGIGLGTGLISLNTKLGIAFILIGAICSIVFAIGLSPAWLIAIVVQAMEPDCDINDLSKTVRMTGSGKFIQIFIFGISLFFRNLAFLFMMIPIASIYFMYAWMLGYISLSNVLWVKKICEEANIEVGSQSNEEVEQPKQKAETKSNDIFDQMEQPQEKRPKTDVLVDTFVAGIRGMSMLDLINVKGQKIRALPVDVRTANGKIYLLLMMKTGGEVKEYTVDRSVISEARDTGIHFNPAQFGIDPNRRFAVSRNWNF